MSKCGPEIKNKIDPNQPAYPVPHSIDGNWVKTPHSECMGMPIRLELAARFISAFITSGNRMSDDIMIRDSFDLVDGLIEKYNQ